MVTPLHKLTTSLKNHYNVFIASASYERRCVSIVNEIIDKVKFDYRLVSLSVPHIELLKHNLSAFEKNDFTFVEVNNADQILTVNNLAVEFEKIMKEKVSVSFLLDITTFTRQTLLILLRLLRNVLRKEDFLQILYTPAKEYSIGLPYEEKWLTRGVLEVNSVFGYSGIIRPSRPYHLIILLGFEVERASSLINSYEPSRITIGYAKKEHSLSNDTYELNKEKFVELLGEFPYAESFEFSCVQISECKLDILKQVEKHKDYNVIISPMNNKLSTLSCALAAFDNDEIQLAISIPAIYNHENYSTPGDFCHVIEMPNFSKSTV